MPVAPVDPAVVVAAAEVAAAPVVVRVADPAAEVALAARVAAAPAHGRAAGPA